MRRSQASFILKSPELIQAAQNGKDDYVQELIDGGANINDKDRLEFTGSTDKHLSVVPNTLFFLYRLQLFTGPVAMATSRLPRSL